MTSPFTTSQLSSSSLPYPQTSVYPLAVRSKAQYPIIRPFSEWTQSHQTRIRQLTDHRDLARIRENMREINQILDTELALTWAQARKLGQPKSDQITG